MTLPLEVGAAYVNASECLARCILKIHGDQVCYFDCGYPKLDIISPLSICGRNQFRRWAARQLAPEEAAKFPMGQARQMSVERFREDREKWIKQTPTHELLAELRRRGDVVIGPEIRNQPPAQN